MSTEGLQLLLAHPDIDVNASPEDGVTPLMMAVLTNDEDVLQALLAHPAINVQARSQVI